MIDLMISHLPPFFEPFFKPGQENNTEYFFSFLNFYDILHLKKESGGVLMSKIYSLSELKSILNPVFSEHGVRKAVLFGSYAKGTATEHSDVDLLVDSGLRGLKFFGLLESVTCALNIPVDLLDVTQIEHGSKVEHEIQNSGVAIYGQ